MKIVAKNRRARFDFEITDIIEAGIVLTGQEVKSCRLGQVNLAGAYVSFLNGFPVLKQAKIAPYRYASGLESYCQTRDRKLLLKRKEIDTIRTVSDQKGMTIVPLEMRAGKFVKVFLGIGRGRKRIDKRERIKEREVERRLKISNEL